VIKQAFLLLGAAALVAAPVVATAGSISANSGHPGMGVITGKTGTSLGLSFPGVAGVATVGVGGTGTNSANASATASGPNASASTMSSSSTNGNIGTSAAVGLAPGGSASVSATSQ
jgi:hypothetical protein